MKTAFQVLRGKELLIACVVFLAASAIAQVPPPPAASQTEVNTGTVANKYVSPKTLANRSGGGGTTIYNVAATNIIDLGGLTLAKIYTNNTSSNLLVIVSADISFNGTSPITLKAQADQNQDNTWDTIQTVTATTNAAATDEFRQLVLSVIPGGRWCITNGTLGAATVNLSSAAGSSSMTYSGIGAVTGSSGSSATILTNADVTVSTFGNNSTGARRGSPFRNVFDGINAMQAGDSLYIAPGAYTETNAWRFPKNVIIENHGSITYVLTNGGSSLNTNNILFQPTDNMVFENLGRFTAGSSNWFNAVCGTATNTPTATNWVIKNLYATYVDSDGLYFAHTNAMQGSIINPKLKGYWDTLATSSAANTNMVITIFGFDLDVSYNNGLSAASLRAINQQGGNFVFVNGVVRANKAVTGNIGIEVAGGRCSVSSTIFDISGSGYTDIKISGSPMFNFNPNNSTRFGQPLVIDNTATTALGAGPSIGFTVFPMNLSFSSDAVGYAFGQWRAVDNGRTDNVRAGIRHTNENSALSTTGFYWDEVGDNDLLAGVQSTNSVPGIHLAPVGLFYIGDNAIVQRGSTNVSSATSFTAVFAVPYADTNYTATAIGNGAALAAQFVSLKTINSCKFNFTSFSGNIDWQITH